MGRGPDHHVVDADLRPLRQRARKGRGFRRFRRPQRVREANDGWPLVVDPAAGVKGQIVYSDSTPMALGCFYFSVACCHTSVGGHQLVLKFSFVAVLASWAQPWSCRK